MTLYESKLNCHLLEETEEERLKKELYHYKWRWMCLTLTCLTVCGGYFCFDNPAAL